jgi:hypothetical protein
MERNITELGNITGIQMLYKPVFSLRTQLKHPLWTMFSRKI